MTNIAFAPGVANSFANLFNLLDVFALQADIASFSPVQVTATLGTTTFTLQGTNLSTSVIGTDIFLTGGMVDSITINENGIDTIFVTSAGLSASAFHTAVLAELATSNSPALEAFLGGLGYTYTGTTGADVLLATTRSSDNVLINLSGADTVNLLGGNDNFFLGIGNDTGNGGNGNDTLIGGNGQDLLLGVAGNDSLNGGNGNDVLRGGGGNDVLNAGAGNDKLFGDLGADRLIGGGGNDALTGGLGGDALAGGAGNDVLSGGVGLDRLTAGLGRDVLTGGPVGGTERDVFIFASAAEIGDGANRDRITDFVSGVDKINLAGLSLDAFRGGLAFTGTQNEARFVVSGGNGFLQIDSDGNGTVNASLLLVGVTNLLVTDLLL